MDANEAVQCFFVISGFYIQLIISEKFAEQGPSWKWQFYKSRAARIFPAYYLFAAIYIAFPTVDLMNEWHTNAPSLIVLNVTLVSGGAMSILKVLGSLVGWDSPSASLIVPTAWSLSPELMFYLIAPFILLRSTTIVGLAGVVLAVASIALAALKTSDIVSMCLFPEGRDHLLQCFPFEMSLFIAGALGYRAYAIIVRRWPWPQPKTGESALHLFVRQPRNAKAVYLLSGICCLASIWYLCLGGSGHTPSSIGKIHLPEAYWFVLVTLIATLPSIFHFSRNFTWDRRIGELSYPVYLGHLLVIRLARNYCVVTPHIIYWVILPTTLLLAIVVWRYVERPVNAWRHRRFENKESLSAAQENDSVPASV
jgi:peptidoglycan/LPS O-acetylase OafA/YrhL